ncbi:MAG TPA: DCC1-like thiol-disulfide oxidoreductase family protein [Bacteroidales bacterium]|nr:DCC1-like thiol-disulfide oxidoreductase family protein [Bacteroidales bacterium]
MFPRLIFTKLQKTQYPPNKPLMAWDGDCGFCHYWVLRWKMITGDKVEYKPLMSVYVNFPDIELKYFKQAVRLIDTDGKIYTGPAAAFRAFRYGSRYRWLMPLYEGFKPAEIISDQVYSFVSRNRNFMYKITVRLWGRNPARQKPYWAYYLAGFSAAALGIYLLF